MRMLWVQSTIDIQEAITAKWVCVNTREQLQYLWDNGNCLDGEDLQTPQEPERAT